MKFVKVKSEVAETGNFFINAFRNNNFSFSFNATIFKSQNKSHKFN